MSIQRVASKWKKTVVMRSKDQLLSYIPDTRKYSLEHLREMLDLYQIVYIKPDHGTYGIGVMSAEQWVSDQDSDSAEQHYLLKFGTRTQVYASLDELHHAIHRKIGKKLFLIQKGIRTLTYDRRKFDIRVLVQKSPQNQWETTGFIGRLAALDKIITNHHSGGEIMPMEELLGQNLTSKQFIKLYKEMKALGVTTANTLTIKYPNLKEIGLDLAIDEEHRPWILEVNTLPALFPFKTLDNKGIYKRIRRYAIHYGRLKGK